MLDFDAETLSAFQSTPSEWRETVTTLKRFGLGNISIHSLRVEGDQADKRQIKRHNIFQSTPSEWRETAV